MEATTLQIAVSVVAVTLTFVGYIPYISDIFKKKTTPHAFTWFVWTLAVGITYALQVNGGAGVGALPTISVGAVCLFIFLVSLKNGSKDITRSDILFLILALAALFLWVGAEQPILSVVLIVLVDVLGFIPTIRKSWNKPRSETLFMYEMSVVRHGLSIIALQQLNILTLLYPIVWTLANLLFSVILIIRRRHTAL